MDVEETLPKEKPIAAHPLNHLAHNSANIPGIEVEETEKTHDLNNNAQMDFEETVKDVSHWTKMIQNAVKERSLEKRREIFEEVLSNFPHSGRHWAMWIDIERKEGHEKFVDSLIRRCLITCNSVIVWEVYLRVMKDKYKADLNDILEESVDGADRKAKDEKNMKTLALQQRMKESFEFAIAFCGFHMHSNKIWKEYVEFVSSVEAATQYSKHEKAEWLRSVFIRLVRTPVVGLEAFMKEYEHFEQTNNRLKAPQLLSEIHEAHSKALSILKERKNYMNGVNLSLLPEHYKGSLKEKDQLNRWMNFLLYEQTNPEEISDVSELKSRLRFYFVQSVAALRFYPEIWYNFSLFEIRFGNDIVSAELVLREGLRANPDSLLLGFALCDLFEEHHLFDKALASYKQLAESMRQHDRSKDSTQSNLEQVYIQYIKYLSRVNGLESASIVFEAAVSALHAPYRLYLAMIKIFLSFRGDKDRAERLFKRALELRELLKGKVEFNTICVEYTKFAFEQLSAIPAMKAFEFILSSMHENDAKNKDTKRLLWVWEKFRAFCLRYSLQMASLVEHQMSKLFIEEVGIRSLFTTCYRYKSIGITSQTYTDASFINRHNTNAVKLKKTLLDDLVGSDEIKIEGAEEDSIPAFLKHILVLLPSKLRGNPPDIDKVLQSVANTDLKSRPTDDFIPGMSIKRKRENEDEDVFTRRQRVRAGL